LARISHAGDDDGASVAIAEQEQQKPVNVAFRATPLLLLFRRLRSPLAWYPGSATIFDRSFLNHGINHGQTQRV
jgi:hypothetical protein